MLVRSQFLADEPMQPLLFDRTSYLTNGERRFLISGEIHYFRAPRNAWADRLQKLKDAGANCVATYMPWLVHEPEEGVFDFADELDPGPFFELCNELGLWVIARPGPYQYSELVCDGLPVWLCERYPELRAKRRDGKDIRYSSISYTHSLFLEKARRWFDAVLPRIAPHQVSRGGAVAAVQVDNELIGIHEWFGDLDHNPETFGIGRNQGRWPSFLESRYGTPEEAAARYGLSAASWSELHPGIAAAGANESRRLAKDYQDCYFRQIADYASTLVGWMREHGVDVPVVHNAGSPYMNAYFLETVDALRDQFVLGSDHYYTLGPSWPQNNPTPQYGVNCFVSLETLRLLGMPPTVFELPGGSLSDFPPFTAHDAACCYLLHVALGAKGFNYYVFCGGRNRHETGTTGDLYDYSAALDPYGTLRPVYQVQQRLAAFLTEHSWLASAEAVVDCRIGIDLELARARRYAAEPTGLLASAAQASDCLRAGLLQTAIAAGIQPGFVDLRAPLPVDGKPLIVVAWDSMGRRLQQNLVNYLHAGGRLLLLGVVPTMDESFGPCTVLADAIGPARQRAGSAPLFRFEIVQSPDVYSMRSYYEWSELPADAVVTARQARELVAKASNVGFRRAFPGGGVLSALGMFWEYAQHAQRHMLKALLADLGWECSVESSNENLWSSLRSDGKCHLLFVLNLLSSPMSSRIRYQNPISGEWVDLREQEVPAMSVRVAIDGRLVDPLDGDGTR
jgi:beta-galactosidase